VVWRHPLIVVSWNKLELSGHSEAGPTSAPSYILKQTWCLSVWTKIGQCLENSSSHSLPVPCGAGDKQGRTGRPRQPLRGAARGAISIKEILEENWGTCI